MNTTESKMMNTSNQRLLAIIATVAAILSIPLVAMQFTNEVKWDSFDFLIMGILLLGTGLLIELVLRTVKKTSHRVILCVFLLLGFLLVWAELAVGIFGSPFAGS